MSAGGARYQALVARLGARLGVQLLGKNVADGLILGVGAMSGQLDDCSCERKRVGGGVGDAGADNLVTASELREWREMVDKIGQGQ